MNDTKMQLEEFIKITWIVIEKKFLKKDFYFDWDKDQRNVREIVIKRWNKQIDFTFGDSLMNSNKKKLINRWTDTYKNIIVEPTNYDLFSCLQTDYVDELFEDRCDNLWYDTDSRRAERIYNNCVKQTYKIKKIFSYNEIRKLLSFEF